MSSDSARPKRTEADVRVYARTLTDSEVETLAFAPLANILRIPTEKRSPEDKAALARAFRDRYAEELRAVKEKAAKLRKEQEDYNRQIPTVMVMEDVATPRETFVLKRGRYDMPDKDQKIDPGITAFRLAQPAGTTHPISRCGADAP